MVDHGPPWSTMVDHRRPWANIVPGRRLLRYLRRPSELFRDQTNRSQDQTNLKRSLKLDHGRPWSTMVDHGRPWSTMVDHGRSWSTNVDHGRPRSTMVHHGRPCNDPLFPAAGSMELVTWPARILEGSPKCKAVGPKIPIILYCKVSRMRRACGKSSGD